MFSSQITTKIYDKLLERPLQPLKSRIAAFCQKYEITSILDLCCGTGRQCYYFAEMGLDTAGLDLDRNMVVHAAQTYLTIPFLLADATQPPIKPGRFKGVSISLALHDKDNLTQTEIIDGAKKIAGPGGFIILLDFENPWNRKSKWGYLLVAFVELFAGREHYLNGRTFLKQGGLSAFLERNGLVEVDRYNSEKACSTIIVARVAPERESHYSIQ